jgi:hypothetical protein
LKLIESPPSDFDNAIVSAMQNVVADSLSGFRSKAITPFERTISIFANQLYLDSLFKLKLYDEFFGVCTILVVTFSGYPFGNTILKRMSTQGWAETSAYLKGLLETSRSQLSSALSSQNGSPQVYVTSLKSLKDCLVTIIKIAGHLMDGLESSRANKDLTLSFSNILKELTDFMK